MYKYNKYKNKKTEIDGIKFDSKKEANRYCELKLLEKAGEIKELGLQVRFELQEGFKKNGKTYRPITYLADFVYVNKKGMTIVEDVKGKKTDVYSIKKKMFEKKFDQLTIFEI